MLRLSKYFSSVKLDDDLYAIFNRLYFKILYVREFELKKILNYDIDIEMLSLMIDYYIYSSEEMDNYIYEEIIKSFTEDNSIRTIYIIPSEFCNMNCKYCFIYNNSNNKIKTIMNINIAEKIIYKISKYMKYINNDKIMIQFYGGEPTLNWNIIEYIVNNLKNYNIDWSIITNGTNFNNKMIDYIKRNNISVGLSLDGPNFINDIDRMYTQKSINFSKIVENLDRLLCKNINLSISLTLTMNVINNKEKVLNWIKTLGVKGVNYNLLHFRNVETDFLKKYYSDSTNFIIDSYNTIGDKIYEDRINRKILSFNNRIFKYSDCSAGAGKQITINSSGDIVYCNCDFLNKNKIIANIKDVNIEEITTFNSIKDEWINKLPIYNKKCIDCDSIFICGGGCISHHNNFGIDEGFCIHTQKMLYWLLKETYKKI